jgi:hypothetical protein
MQLGASKKYRLSNSPSKVAIRIIMVKERFVPQCRCSPSDFTLSTCAGAGKVGSKTILPLLCIAAKVPTKRIPTKRDAVELEQIIR